MNEPSQSLKNSMDQLKQIQEKQDLRQTPLWYYITENGKPAISELKLAEEIIFENDFFTNNYFNGGYRYDKKLGHWRLGYEEWLSQEITNKLKSVGYWRVSTFNSVKLLIKNQIYKDHAFNIFENSNPYLVSFKNGTYDIKTGNLKPNDPKDYILNGHNYNLETKGKAKITNQWFKESLGSADTLMKEFIGYMFCRTYQPFQKFIILQGNGGNGKSTFLNYIRRVITEANTSNVPLYDLTGGGDTTRFSTARLYGKELNFFADISDNLLKETSILKSMTGDDYMKAEFKNKDPFDFLNYAKLVFSANKLPNFRDFTEGFARRPLLIEFLKIENFDQKYNMENIHEEIPTFVYQCLIAFKKALERGKLSETPETVFRQQEWLEKNSSVSRFLKDNYITTSYGSCEPAVYVYNDYVQYCQEDGVHALSKPNFTDELEGKGILKIKKRIETKPTWVYTSIKAKDNDDKPFQPFQKRSNNVPIIKTL